MTRPYTLSFQSTPETFINDLLLARGIEDELAQENFLSPNYEYLHNPYQMYEMQIAVDRILTAVENNEKIVIFSDYDCDGIPGAVVLHDFFEAAEYKNFTNVIPHRHYEGFGLSVEAVEKMAKGGARLIITIDCGTSDIDAINKANELGVDVIVTDHHEPGAELPKAVAVINPKLGEYPFPHLCGAGVVFKLVQALIATEKFSTIKKGQEKWWLDMVGVATIADMVPLVGENRILAHYGLMVLRKSKRPGLAHLLRVNKIPQQYLTEDDIGFTIGPRINAASRMDAPEHAFSLLTTKDVGEAGAYVDKLEKLNTERKSTVALMTKEINHRLSEMNEIPAVLVMGNPLWRPALVGLAANKLAETYKRPVFLWGRDGNEVIKGSCRSGGDISVVKLMEESSGVFHEYGGHHASGGFSVIEEQIFNLPNLLQEAFSALGKNAVVENTVTVDAELNLEDVYGPIRSAQNILAPFGTGHPKPLFAFTGVVPEEVILFGKTKEHLKVTFKTKHGFLEAIAFFATETDFSVRPQTGVAATFLAHIEESYFMGRKSTRLRIIDVV